MSFLCSIFVINNSLSVYMPINIFLEILHYIVHHCGGSSIMIYYAPTIIIILFYMIIISVAVALAAMFSLYNSESPDHSILINMYCTLSFCQINMFLPSFLPT